MTTLGQVKINGEYDWIETTAPTAAEKAPVYTAGDRWLNLTDGKSYVLSDADAGTWAQIETALDARINLILTQTFNRVMRECYQAMARPRQEKLTEAPDTISRTDLYYLGTYISIYADWTISGASFSVTDEDDVIGDLEDFEYEDYVYLLGSRRNDGVKQVEEVIDYGLTFGAAGNGTSDRAVIMLVDIPVDFDIIVGRMLYYDAVTRRGRQGLESESIGNYSYSTVGDVPYPADVVAGLDSYMNGPIGDAEWIP